MVDLPENPGAIESTLGIGSEVKDIYQAEDGVMVNVFITGPKSFPIALKEARAKSKAVQAVGVADVTIDTFEDMVVEKKIDRLTDVQGYQVFEDEGYIREVGSRPVLDRFELGKVEVVAFGILVNSNSA